MKRFLVLTICICLLISCFGCKKKNVQQEVIASTDPPVDLVPDVVPKDTDSMEIKEEDFRLFIVKAGKADAAVLSADGKNYLIDAGKKESAIAVLAALHYLGISKLDGAFLTHTHSDHIGGFSAIAENIPIERIYMSVYSESKKNGENKIVNLGEKNNIPVSALDAGDMVLISDRCLAEVLGPTELNTEDDNDNSLVLCICYKDLSVLMAADMQFEEERCIIDKWGTLKSDLLKVGNHGNPDASSMEFLENVNPSFAVISTDRSVDEDSANPVVLGKLSGADVTITDETEHGVLFCVTENGTLQKEFPKMEAQSADVTIADKNVKEQTVSIENKGSSDADISGYMVCSTKGYEIFVFPKNTVLKSGEKLILGPAGGKGDYLWKTEDKPWNKNKEDSALLFDKYGNIVSRFN